MQLLICAQLHSCYAAVRTGRGGISLAALIWEDGVYVGDPAGERRADEASGQRAPPSEAHAHAPARAQPATWQAGVL